MATELNDAEDQKLWPPQMEKLFIDIMVEEYIKGTCQMVFLRGPLGTN